MDQPGSSKLSRKQSPNPFSPQVYANYPELDQIMLLYLGMEELVQRWKLEPELFEQPSSLNTLADRFDLPQAASFKALLKEYDTKYATTRSYFLRQFEPDRIMLQAAGAGNLQAFYDGLKLYPSYKEPLFLNEALRRAARGGHQVMIDLLKDLGASAMDDQLFGTIEGGHLDRLEDLIAGLDLDITRLDKLSERAAGWGQLEILEYLVSLWIPSLEQWNNLLYWAGEGGDRTLIEYLISQGANDYAGLIQGAIEVDNTDLVIEYLDAPDLDYDAILKAAILANNLVVAERVVQGRIFDPAVLNNLLGIGNQDSMVESIDYLISLGADDYTRLLWRLVALDHLELFKRYYRQPGINYEKVFIEALVYQNLSIIRYMFKKQLVKLDPAGLNSYLRKIRFHLVTVELLDLFFSLGATDYNYVIKKAISRGNLEVFKRYFHRSGLDPNQMFEKVHDLDIYKYLVETGEITQGTLDCKLTRLIPYDSASVTRIKNYLISLGAKPF
jgi:hypothetical protein